MMIALLVQDVVLFVHTHIVHTMEVRITEEALALALVALAAAGVEVIVDIADITAVVKLAAIAKHGGGHREGGSRHSGGDRGTRSGGNVKTQK
jgi:hypothetical protein